MSNSNEFHKHLDGCLQCRNHPFDLRPEGGRLLKEIMSRPFRPELRELVEENFKGLLKE